MAPAEAGRARRLIVDRPIICRAVLRAAARAARGGCHKRSVHLSIPGARSRPRVRHARKKREMHLPTAAISGLSIPRTVISLHSRRIPPFVLATARWPLGCQGRPCPERAIWPARPRTSAHGPQAPKPVGQEAGLRGPRAERVRPRPTVKRTSEWASEEAGKRALHRTYALIVSWYQFPLLSHPTSGYQPLPARGAKPASVRPVEARYRSNDVVRRRAR